MEKNPKIKKLIKVIKGTCSICGRNKSQNFTKLMIFFFRKGNRKNKHCSPMSNTPWCDLNSKGDILKIQDKCPNPKCNCQKILTFTPHQYMLQSGLIKC